MFLVLVTERNKMRGECWRTNGSSSTSMSLAIAGNSVAIQRQIGTGSVPLGNDSSSFQRYISISSASMQPRFRVKSAEVSVFRFVFCRQTFSKRTLHVQPEPGQLYSEDRDLRGEGGSWKCVVIMKCYQINRINSSPEFISVLSRHTKMRIPIFVQ